MCQSLSMTILIGFIIEELECLWFDLVKSVGEFSIKVHGHQRSIRQSIGFSSSKEGKTCKLVDQRRRLPKFADLCRVGGAERFFISL